jgi:DNA mismatch repair protein MutS
LDAQFPGVRNYNVAVKEWEDQVVFLHQIVPGAADKSYGIHVAQLAGVPRRVNERAREVLAWLEAQHDAEGEGPHRGMRSSNGRSSRTAGGWQMSLFATEEHPLLDEIRAADLDEISPREALALLQSWQERLKRGASGTTPTPL